MVKPFTLCLFFMTATLQAQTAASPMPEAPPAAPVYPGTKFEVFREMFNRKTDFDIPENNPSTPEKILLGKTLFFDQRLSGNNSMSCATCHNPALAWSDGLPVAIGAGGKKLTRRTPSLLNVAMFNSLQWDGAFNLLEDQALSPISKKTEMNQDLKRLPAKIKAIKGYIPLFEAAFPGEPISVTNIAKALASFQRTLISGLSPFEAFLKGDDMAMSIDAKNGMVIFNEKARCSACHTGWTLTDSQPYDLGHKTTDRGRQLFTKQSYDAFKFRNPSLLDVARRPPYMHDGSFPDLTSVIEFYDRGGDVRRPSTSNDLRPLHLTSLEKAQLEAFLKTLNGKLPEVETPTLPE